MTKYEIIKNMTLEEMAEFFRDRTKCCTCDIKNICQFDLCCKDAFERWLNQEADS